MIPWKSRRFLWFIYIYIYIFLPGNQDRAAVGFSDVRQWGGCIEYRRAPRGKNIVVEFLFAPPVNRSKSVCGTRGLETTRETSRSIGRGSAVFKGTRYLWWLYERPVFSLGVSHMHKITKHENLKFQENDERKNALIAKLQMHNKVEC